MARILQEQAERTKISYHILEFTSIVYGLEERLGTTALLAMDDARLKVRNSKRR